MNARRRPKGDKRARTCSKLLEAARELVREKGYEHTTMEEVASRAGMTSGAIYGNFRNRAELFAALGQAYWAPIKPEIKPGSSFVEIMHALAEATIAAIPDRRGAAVGRLTGVAYTLANDQLLVQVREATIKSYDAGAAWLRGAAATDDLPLPPDVLVRVIHAMIEGLVLQRILTPELVTDDVIRAAFAALAGEHRRKWPADFTETAL